MRILHVYKTALPESVGGIEQVVHTLALQARAYGIDSGVLALCKHESNSGTIRHTSYDLHRFQRNFEVASMPVSLGLLRQYAQLAKQADLIHYHYPWPFMDLLHLSLRARPAAIVTYHADIVRQRKWLRLYRPLQSRFLQSVSRIVATSPNYLASSSVLQEHKSKVSVIPIGIDPPETAQQPKSQRLHGWLQRLGPRFFLFVGVLRYYKGLEFLLQAAQGTTIPIVIVGDGPQAAALLARAQSLDLKYVHFLGHLEEVDKHALLASCEALVFPSHLRSEAFGLSLVEAAMHAKAMISCDINTGTNFVNVDGETGLVVPPGNFLALRKAMYTLWDHPDIAAAYGERAQQRYLQLFTGENMVRSYVNLYRDIGKAPSFQN